MAHIWPSIGRYSIISGRQTRHGGFNEDLVCLVNVAERNTCSQSLNRLGECSSLQVCGRHFDVSCIKAQWRPKDRVSAISYPW